MRKTRERERERERERRRRRPTRARESERRERPTLCVWGFRVSRFVTRASTARGRVVCERHTFSGEFPSVSTDLRVLCADRGRVHAAQLDLGRARADARLLPRQRRDALTVPGASSLSRLNRIFSYLFVSFVIFFSAGARTDLPRLQVRAAVRRYLGTVLRRGDGVGAGHREPRRRFSSVLFHFKHLCFLEDESLGLSYHQCKGGDHQALKRLLNAEARRGLAAL